VGGGAGQGEAEEGIGEGDGDTRQDALVDAGLAGAEEAAQLLGTVAHLLARAPLADGHERGEVMAGDEVGQAVRGERAGHRRGLTGEQASDDEDAVRRHQGLVGREFYIMRAANSRATLSL
jgi:hypothetical protein